MNAAEVVNALLEERFGVARGEVTADTPLRNLRLDSLALEELRVLIEERLEIDLEEVSLTSRDTVGQLVAAIDGKVAA
ncbi:acyl carrier protein [Streptomyces noursei]|uniref:Acyl carrier protein n=1 Tax=Streptomyces noursei TaxID=1971 RepID=A0A059WDV3_STRNR|nr:acyl carrier protein [Streptomyces noursei]AIA07573.1 putative acyl carrier protein [Streptomyces noursei]EXU86808.1 acyl carrier protein [Streptomyces noursei PD-1]MCE4945357.1 acyl carrier protein [Streptomyces noursei]MCZ0975129.1 acyl carrier protein [Streptomyces noursei]UWS75945.1 acyl carrier protein [Streptomyces noursei]